MPYKIDIGLRINLCQRYGSSSMQSGYGSNVECTKGFKLFLCLVFLANVETLFEQRMPRSYGTWHKKVIVYGHRYGYGYRYGYGRN